MGFELLKIFEKFELKEFARQFIFVIFHSFLSKMGGSLFVRSSNEYLSSKQKAKIGFIISSHSNIQIVKVKEPINVLW